MRITALLLIWRLVVLFLAPHDIEKIAGHERRGTKYAEDDQNSVPHEDRLSLIYSSGASANAPRTIDSVMAPGSICPRERSPEALALPVVAIMSTVNSKPLRAPAAALAERVVYVGTSFRAGDRRRQRVDHGLVAGLGAAARLDRLLPFLQGRGIGRRIERVRRQHLGQAPMKKVPKTAPEAPPLLLMIAMPTVLNRSPAVAAGFLSSASRAALKPRAMPTP